MIDGKTISLVVPCRNEEKIIAGFIRKVPKYVDEILIVDNGSSDRTAEVARKYGARVITENRSVNGIGYGFAHLTGIRQATGDFIVAMDGDDTYPVKSIRKIIHYMRINCLDFVSCNRLPLTNRNAISPTRQFGIKILNFLVRVLYGYPMHDILTGMWVVRRDVARAMNLTQGGWDLSPEIKLAALVSPEIAFEEYHIRHFARENEPSKQNIFKTGFGHVRYILQRRFTTDNRVIGAAVNFARYINAMLF